MPLTVPPSFEPYRIRMGSPSAETPAIAGPDPTRFTSRAERRRALEQANFDLFRVPSRLVMVDLLTDSGTSAMSDRQWAAMMRADESYAGSASFERLVEAAAQITGIGNVIPVAQGRLAERLLVETLIGADGEGHGLVVPSNAHFDTTRRMIERSGGGGAEAASLLTDAGRDAEIDAPFKGNIDLARLEALLTRSAADVPFVMLTLTCNSNGGQPISLANVRATRALCDRFSKLLILDACRVAENAWMIREREAGQRSRAPSAIVRDIFDLCDGAALSARKDLLCNTGGMLMFRDRRLHERACRRTVLTEGFGMSYGGVAARDLEAMAVGFEEAVDEARLAARAASLEAIVARLNAANVPIVTPPGGHAIFLDAASFCPHPAGTNGLSHALACALYEHSGVRGCHVGSLLRRQGKPLDLVRLAVPRRRYTDTHLAYVADAIVELWRERSAIALVESGGGAARAAMVAAQKREAELEIA